MTGFFHELRCNSGRRGVGTPPYELRLCAHRRGGIYAARGFAWAVVGGRFVGEGFIPPGKVTGSGHVPGSSGTPTPTAGRAVH